METGRRQEEGILWSKVINDTQNTTCGMEHCRHDFYFFLSAKVKFQKVMQLYPPPLWKFAFTKSDAWHIASCSEKCLKSMCSAGVEASMVQYIFFCDDICLYVIAELLDSFLLLTVIDKIWLYSWREQKKEFAVYLPVLFRSRLKSKKKRFVCSSIADMIFKHNSSH